MINQQWPTYSDADGNYVTALPIKTVNQAVDGSANAEFDGAYEDRYLSAQFMAVFHPVATGYLFRSQYGELLYMAKAAFEAKFTKSAGTPTAWGDVTGKPSTFAPTIGTTATTAMAGNKAPTTTDRGGVLQQAAESALCFPVAIGYLRHCSMMYCCNPAICFPAISMRLRRVQ